MIWISNPEPLSTARAPGPQLCITYITGRKLTVNALGIGVSLLGKLGIHGRPPPGAKMPVIGR